MLDYRDFIGEVLISEERLKARVCELGKQISQDYRDANLLLVCILRGGVVFLTDLMRCIDIPHMIEFMGVSSYAVGTRMATGQVRITLDLNIDIADRDVLLVEDIVDSGHTLRNVLELLTVRKPHSLNICALLDKYERREVEIPLKYTGFRIPDRFVFGYGLDIDDYYRSLPFIGAVDLQRYAQLLEKKA